MYIERLKHFLNLTIITSMKRKKSEICGFVEKCKKLMVFALFIVTLFLLWYSIFHLRYSQNEEEKRFPTIPPAQPEKENIYYEKPESNEFNGLKVVHLDLKGAPPKISYYKQLFPVLANLGANGLLIEYEDMFPYTGVLSNISSLNSYSIQKIETINKLAKLSNLTVIPLIQTVGHLEFVLKLKEFHSLRATPGNPHLICPNNKNSLIVIFEMIDQVIKAHSGIEKINIGMNDVRFISECNSENEVVYKQNTASQKNKIFLEHVTEIAKHIRKNHPHINILMYDDQLRNIPIEELRVSGIGNLIEPVVWKYSTDVYLDLGPSLWHMYMEIFSKIWISSAFKGATGSDKYLTDVTHHLENHRSWLNIVSELKEKIQFEGIIMSGKQRYDHFSILCELLPVSIPSLALCLRLLKGYDDSPLSPPTNVAKILQCDQPYGLLGPAFGSPRCSYPGAKILENILRYHQIRHETENIFESDKFRGWMNDYNIQYSFSNPQIVERTLSHLERLILDLNDIDAEISEAFAEVYDGFTVREWRTSFLLPVKNKINKILERKDNLLSPNDWPRRPFVR